MKKFLHSKEFGALLILLAEVLFFAWRTRLPSGESLFLQMGTFSLVMNNFFPIAIASLGAALIIVSGGIDLSVGSLICLGAVSAGETLHHGAPIWIAILAGLVAALLAGAANGLLVSIVKIPPFIATLGMMSIARGIAYRITSGETRSAFPAEFVKEFGQAKILSIPVPTFLLLLLLAVVFFWERRSRWGRYVYAIGGNEEAARLAGIRVDWIRGQLYALAGVFAGFAGVLYVARYDSVSSTVAWGYELDVIAACVIGGISLSGGQGSVLGAVLGAAIMGTLETGLGIMNISPFWIQTVKGAAVVLAVALDRWKHLLPFLAQNAVFAPLRAMPRPLVAALSECLGSMVYLAAGKRRRIAEENVRRALGNAEAKRIARASFVHMVRVGIETAQLPRWQGKLASAFHAEGLEHLRAAREKGRGVLAAVSHLGNWEYGAAAIADAGFPVAVMVRPPSNAWARDTLQQIRDTMRLETIPRRAGLEGLRRALAEGKVVLLAMDQHASKNDVVVEFFGRPVRTVNVTALLALRNLIPVVPMFTWRERDGFHARIEPEVEVERTGDLRSDIQRITQEITNRIEAAIREHPEQWLWMHRRWREEGMHGAFPDPDLTVPMEKG